MKRYSEYMEEISSEDLYKGLLAHGMFSDKLPPIFTSEHFFSIVLIKSITSQTNRMTI